MKKIKIPKVSEGWHMVDILKSKTTPWQVVLKKQTIEGNLIPKDSIIAINTRHHNFGQFGDKVEIHSEKINALLKYLYLEKLRNEH